MVIGQNEIGEGGGIVDERREADDGIGTLESFDDAGRFRQRVCGIRSVDEDDLRVGEPVGQVADYPLLPHWRPAPEHLLACLRCPASD